MRRGLILSLLILTGCGPAAPTRVGSKADNESVLLGEMATLLARQSGSAAEHRRGLGGTLVVWEALKAGEVDVYPEFTGTLAFQILNDPALVDVGKLRERLAADGLALSRPLGYENNYALGVRAGRAAELGLNSVSDLNRHPSLVVGLSTEFTLRQDGWPALKARYGLPFARPRPLEHAIAYKALADGQIDVTDVYTTDAEIERFKLKVLADDKAFFPRYAAAWLYRKAWADANPDALAALTRLEGKLDEPTMRAANARTQDRAPEGETAAGVLLDRIGLTVQSDAESSSALLWRHTLRHLTLVVVSLTAAIAVAIPLGVYAARRPRTGQVVVGVLGLVQTVPSLALLVILVAVPFPVGGLGPRPAVLALFLYSLLPIVRNTAAGLADIPTTLREAADGLGLSNFAKLRLIELPMASRAILAGVKTACVINIGTATLGAFVDAGGLGVPIQEGLRSNDTRWILYGALSAAGLALLAQGAFELAERRLIPAGLRLGAAR